MKILLISILLLQACSKQFQALSPKEKMRGTPTVTVTMNEPETLPICNMSTEGLSVYLAKDGLMFKCRGGAWSSLKGGGLNWGFAARGLIRYNQWEDSQTRKRWAVVSQAHSSNLENMCRNGWRLPGKDELVKASSNGLFHGIKASGGMAHHQAWSNDFEMKEGQPSRIIVNVAPRSQQGKQDPGVYCVLDS